MKKDPLLPLKLLVYGMGVMLVGGFIWLSIRLVDKAAEMNSGQCSEIALPAVPDGYTLTQAEFSDGHWIMHYNHNEGATLLLRYDACGKLVQKVTVPQ